jgi:hypothetical protein
VRRRIRGETCAGYGVKRLRLIRGPLENHQVITSPSLKSNSPLIKLESKMVAVIEAFDDSGLLGYFPDMRHKGRPFCRQDIMGFAERARKFFMALFPGNGLKVKITEEFIDR